MRAKSLGSLPRRLITDFEQRNVLGGNDREFNESDLTCQLFNLKLADCLKYYLFEHEHAVINLSKMNLIFLR